MRRDKRRKEGSRHQRIVRKEGMRVMRVDRGFTPKGVVQEDFRAICVIDNQVQCNVPWINVAELGKTKCHIN